LALNEVLFYLFGALAIATTLLVVVQPNPVHSVLLLIGSFGALAGLYVLLDAPFAAVIQIIVYAGAIMVLFLFVVMLLNAPREETPPGMFESGTSRFFGVVLAVALAGELVWALRRSRVTAARITGEEMRFSVPEIGEQLFGNHAFAFEATSILIIVAMVGAIALAGGRAGRTKSSQPHTDGAA
jgi:NADH-quinone oxidoreductase subunit J